MIIKVITLLIVFFSSLYSLSEVIDEGLSYQIFKSPQKSMLGNSEIVVIQVDPNFYNINLFSSEQYNHGNLTAKNWAKEHELIIAINAGMFQLSDYSSNVGYMKQFDYINNSNINSFQSVAAFNPKDSTQVQFKILDFELINGKLNKNDIKTVIANYESVVQNLRLIKKPKEDRWDNSNKNYIWSEVALGEDSDGNMLLIFSRSPYWMSDLNNILIDLPINIECAQHLEGGPEASLYLKYKTTELEFVGIYESTKDFYFNDIKNNYWEIPNIIGITKK